LANFFTVLYLDSAAEAVELSRLTRLPLVVILISIEWWWW